MSRPIGQWIAFVLSLVAVLAVAVAIQSFAQLFNHRIDLTAQSRLSLSNYSLEVLKEVESPLRIDYFYRRGDRVPARDLLALMSDNCPKLTYDLVELDRNPQRAKDHGVDRYDRAVLFYDGREIVTPGGDEANLIGGISRILHEKARVLYFLENHRERSLAMGKDDQLGRAGQLLRQEGYDLRNLSLLQTHDIPEDADAVVIAGPEVDPVEQEIAALDSYLQKGGSVLVLVDPIELPRLEAWIASHGLKLANDVVIDRANRVYGSDGTNVIVPYYRDQPVTKELSAPSVLGRARSVALPAGQNDDETSRAHIVARSAKESFVASDVSRARNGAPEFDPNRDQQGPVGVMGVTLVGADGEDAGRLVVIGDADFATDNYIALLGNKDLLVNTIEYLVEKKSRGARKPDQTTSLGPVSPVYVSNELAQIIFWVTVVVEPLLLIVIGIGVAIVRRRRR